MPTNRTPVSRPWRSGRFTGELLTLFARLERVPLDERDDGWRKDSRRLATMLGEEFEDAWFCGGLCVLDRRLADYHPPGVWGQEVGGRESKWAMVLAAREKLLVAVGERERVH
jgi:hypothetical protein